MNASTGHITTPNGLVLHYRSWTPDGPSRASVAVVHGWSDHSGRYMNLVDALVPSGYAVYALDLRGHGRSDGPRGHIDNWSDYRSDVRQFLDMVYKQGSPTFLLGHSMGGLTVLDFAIHYPAEPLAGLIASAPLLDVPAVSPFLIKIMRGLSRLAPRMSINPGADSTTISRDVGVIEAYNADPFVHKTTTPRSSVLIAETQAFVLANLDGIRYPYLLVFGEADKLVPTPVTRASFESVGSEDKTFFAYPGGYHELINDLVKEQVLIDIRNWLDEHSPAPTS